MTQTTKILIVDDDSDLRSFIRLSIDNGKRVIAEAGTALDGLRLATKSPPDILLLDIGLPGHFNGFSLCESLCKNPQHHKLQVVVISGHGETEDIEQAKRLGVVAYIVKPFSPTTLVALIDQMESRFNEMLTIVP